MIDWTGSKVKAIHSGALKATQAGFNDANLTDMTAIAGRLLDLGFGAVGGATSYAGKAAYDALTTSQQAAVFNEVLAGVE